MNDPNHGEKELLIPKEKELIPENGEIFILIIQKLMLRPSKPPFNLTNLQQWKNRASTRENLVTSVVIPNLMENTGKMIFLRNLARLRKSLPKAT